LAKRLGELRSRPMNIVVNPPDTAKSRRSAEHSSFQRFSFQHFSFTQIPLFPRNPLIPALRSGPDSYTQIGLRELSVQSAAQAAGSARALACCFRRPRRKLSASTVHGRTRMSSARAPKTTREGACAPQREPYPRSHSQGLLPPSAFQKMCIKIRALPWASMPEAFGLQIRRLPMPLTPDP
jgi:hypothetical protein